VVVSLRTSIQAPVATPVTHATPLITPQNRRSQPHSPTLPRPWGGREALKRSDDAPRGLIPGLQLVIGAGAGHPADAADTHMSPTVLPLWAMEGGRRVLRQHSSLFVTVEPRDAVAPCRVLTGERQG